MKLQFAAVSVRRCPSNNSLRYPPLLEALCPSPSCRCRIGTRSLRLGAITRGHAHDRRRRFLSRLNELRLLVNDKRVCHREWPSYLACCVGFEFKLSFANATQPPPRMLLSSKVAKITIFGRHGRNRVQAESSVFSFEDLSLINWFVVQMFWKMFPTYPTAIYLTFRKRKWTT